MKLSLTIPAIKGIDAPGYYWDDKTPGFCLKVTSNRGKLRKMFILQRKLAGETVTVSLGVFEQEVTLTEAREKALDTVALIRQGISPNHLKRQQAVAKAEEEAALKAKEAALQRDQEARSLTVRKALDDYVVGKGKKLASSTSKTYKYTVEKHLGDWLDMSLRDITSEMVSDRYKDVCNLSIGSANNAFRCLRAVCGRVVKLHKGQVISENPVRILSDLDEWQELKPRDKILPETMFKSLWSALDSLENQDFADYFRLLFLTGLRSEESFGLRWENIDFDKEYWTVTDTKNGRDHSLPMTRTVKEILLRRKQFTSSPWVFSGKKVEGNMGDSEHQQKIIRKAINYPDFNAHMLRKTFATKSAETVPTYMVKRFLNHHSKSDVTSHNYIKMELDSLREPLQKVEDKILSLCLLKKSERIKRVV
ncbi:MAG: tyrosine-type recombinase/integrase [Candidatus Obscuribacter sp.]|nr:tyrosine-type recombinase/integrase [Candidatus Obscuribacter sp.]MBK9618881.1 tyrosine-type recombinase/integrase [Candidatus Obscuribacter sp.]